MRARRAVSALHGICTRAFIKSACSLFCNYHCSSGCITTLAMVERLSFCADTADYTGVKPGCLSPQYGPLDLLVVPYKLAPAGMQKINVHVNGVTKK